MLNIESEFAKKQYKTQNKAWPLNVLSQAYLTSFFREVKCIYVFHKAWTGGIPFTDAVLVQIVLVWEGSAKLKRAHRLAVTGPME